MSSLLYLLLFYVFYVFAGIGLSGSRLPLVKELSGETAAFSYFQVSPEVRLSENSRNNMHGNVQTYRHGQPQMWSFTSISRNINSMSRSFS